MRVLWALILREMATRFGRSIGGYAWAVIEPVAVLALLSAVFSQISHRPPLGTSFPFYFATGYLAFHLYADLAQKLGQSLQVNRALLAYPCVSPLDTILARFVLQSLTLIIVFIVIVGAVMLTADVPAQLSLSAIYLAATAAFGLGFAVGLLNAGLFVVAPLWERIFFITNRPMFLISGVFFSFEALPRDIREVLWFNPLIHIVGLMREGFFPGYRADYVSPAYLAAFIGAGLFLAILLLRAGERRMIEP